MKQKTCAVQDSFDAVKFIEEVKSSSYYADAKTVLVNIFTERIDTEYVSYISNLVQSKLDKAKIAGLTCLAGFAHGEKLKKTTILTFLFFYDSEIEILEYDFSEISIEKAKENFLSRIENSPDLKGIQVFTTPLINNGTNDFLSDVNFKHQEIPIFGAGAGYASSAEEQKLYIFADKIHENGIVIILFKGKNLKIYAESTLGWTPIGKELTVTEVIDNHIIKTIDNEDAGEVFKTYLGVTSSSNFIANTCEFPFMLQRGDKWLARMPIKKDDAGAIHFTADVHPGEKLLFSYGSKRNILQQSFNLAEYMSRKNLEGLLLHVCRNRYDYMKDDEILELQAFSNFYRETAGCYAFSEILYKNNSGGLQNSALVAVGFRETNDNDTELYAEDCYIEDITYGKNLYIDFNKQGSDLIVNKRNIEILPFEERLVNFLHATSRDLYLANKKLEETATTDGLTKIFNRKKMCELINYELKKRSTKNINLIMFDIDNFKRINDTYGHDAGDEVLVRISATARKGTRSQDSIGRWGGEEFMILVTDAKKNIAVEIAERIRSDIHNLKWQNMNPISISLGVASLKENDDFQSFYKRVDNRLYYAKMHGKNRVISEDEEETV